MKFFYFHSYIFFGEHRFFCLTFSRESLCCLIFVALPPPTAVQFEAVGMWHAQSERESDLSSGYKGNFGLKAQQQRKEGGGGKLELIFPFLPSLIFHPSFLFTDPLLASIFSFLTSFLSSSQYLAVVLLPHLNFLSRIIISLLHLFILVKKGKLPQVEVGYGNNAKQSVN